jgi:hypothetical protein
VIAWEVLLGSFSGCFTAPSFALFAELASAWVCCPARRTVCGIIATADPTSVSAHDAHHRFLRAGAWSLAALFEVLARLAVGSLCGAGDLAVDIDDTLFNKSGTRVAGAGNFRDPIRSTGGKVVYALGLNLVVATLRITPPWGGEPLGLPVNMRLYRKGGRSHTELAEDMISEIESWFPGRVVVACADGAYACLARASLTARRWCPGCSAMQPCSGPAGKDGRAARQAPQAWGSPADSPRPGSSSPGRGMEEGDAEPAGQASRAAGSLPSGAVVRTPA